MKENVGIAIIGTGFARRVQIPAFSMCENTRVVSVASGSLENAEATAKEFDIPHFTADWRESVARDDVDLVCITTPPNLHREMALFSLEHRKHILCEKPMAMNVVEAEEMCEAAKGAGVLALIDHELRFQPGRQKAFAMLRDGVIGKIRHAKYNFRASHRGDQNVPWNWWSDAKQGGGALGAINSHIIDSFNWFLGSEISSVFCQLQTHIKQRPFDGGVRDVTTDDEANMLLRFANADLTEDATGIVSVSMTEGPEYINRIEFFGTLGSIRVDHQGDVYLAKSGETKWTEIEVEFASGIEGITESGFPSGFVAFAPKLIDAIRSDSSSLEHAATFEDGLKVQKVLDAAKASSSTGAANDPFASPA
ncbi:MAG: Gfo/Idh/MocA family protein [Pyrinomonadaceae bacterium]